MGAKVSGCWAYPGLAIGVVAAGAGTHARYCGGGCVGHVPIEDPWRRWLVERLAQSVELLDWVGWKIREVELKQKV